MVLEQDMLLDRQLIGVSGMCYTIHTVATPHNNTQRMKPCAHLQQTNHPTSSGFDKFGKALEVLQGGGECLKTAAGSGT